MTLLPWFSQSALLKRLPRGEMSPVLSLSSILGDEPMGVVSPMSSCHFTCTSPTGNLCGFSSIPCWPKKVTAAFFLSPTPAPKTAWHPQQIRKGPSLMGSLAASLPPLLSHASAADP